MHDESFVKLKQMSNVAKGFESFFCIIYHNQCHLSEIDKTCEMEKPIQ